MSTHSHIEWTEATWNPVVGCGTTLEVAVKHGRRAVGCELNPEYAKLARARTDAALESLGMFKPIDCARAMDITA